MTNLCGNKPPLRNGVCVFRGSKSPPGRYLRGSRVTTRRRVGPEERGAVREVLQVYGGKRCAGRPRDTHRTDAKPVDQTRCWDPHKDLGDPRKFPQGENEGSRTCLGAHLAVQRAPRPGGPRIPTPGCRRRIPKRTSAEGPTNRAQNSEYRSALGTGSSQTPPGPGQQPHLPLRLHGFAERRAWQLQHPIRADAIEGPASRRAAPAHLHPVYIPVEATAQAGIATRTPTLPALPAPVGSEVGPRSGKARGRGGTEGGRRGKEGWLRGRGGSRRSARGGAFSLRQSARGRRR